MPNKLLGQHWLKDRAILEEIAESADLVAADTVLEIGPGLGSLTSVLLAHAGKVIAIEYDEELARKLPGQFPGKNLEVITADFLSYDLDALPPNYKLVANVPYYITSKIIEHVIESKNLPSAMVLLMQQEVAEKLAATTGQNTLLSLELQRIFNIQLGTRVPKMYFIPEPKIDSQVLICKKLHVAKIAEEHVTTWRRLVRAGFSAPRKKLRTSLSGGLSITVADAETLLKKAAIDPNKRAQELTLDEWKRLL